jgi:hypothetical protein
MHTVRAFALVTVARRGDLKGFCVQPAQDGGILAIWTLGAATAADRPACRSIKTGVMQAGHEVMIVRIDYFW